MIEIKRKPLLEGGKVDSRGFAQANLLHFRINYMVLSIVVTTYFFKKKASPDVKKPLLCRGEGNTKQGLK